MTRDSVATVTCRQKIFYEKFAARLKSRIEIIIAARPRPTLSPDVNITLRDARAAMYANSL